MSPLPVSSARSWTVFFSRRGNPGHAKKLSLKILSLEGFAATREYVRFFFDPVGCMCRIYARHGPIIALGPIALGEPRQLVFAIGPDFNRQVLSDPTAFRPTGMLRPGPKKSAQRRVRFGLTRMTGPQHKQQRQLVTPPFHKKAVQSYRDLIVSITDALLKQWQVGERRDVYEEMRILTLRIASAVLFSRDPEEAFPVGRLIEEWIIMNFSTGVWSCPLNVPGTPYRRMLRQAERIEQAILEMIARRRANPGRRTDVLSLLMEARDNQGYGMTDTELVGQTAILFLASFETTTSSLTWTLFLLAQHPDVANELINELETVLGGDPPDNDALAQLPFLECVIKESMRILPPVPYTVRVTQRDLTLGPLALAHGTNVVCSHYLTHHLPELYPEPKRFLPERWRTIDPNQYEYLPFSAGPRMCIGPMLAMQTLKISLAMILQRFRFAVVPGTRIDRTSRITMNPQDGLPMMLFGNDRKFATSEVSGQIREMVALP
jgi:cytochrome P450